MNRKFSKCSNSRITKFYGPLGTGKTTLVYVFFKTISFAQNLLDSDDATGNEIKKDKINLKDVNLSKRAKIKIKKYQNNVQNYIEVNDNLNLSNSSFEESSIDSNKQNHLINLDEIEEKEICYKRKESKEGKKRKESKENIEIKQIISPYYDKEFEGYDSTEEEYNFLSSFYVNLEKERTEDLSRSNQKYVEYELIK
jgi:ABC-type lipopolysaccharide export system ATPase subunit